MIPDKPFFPIGPGSRIQPSSIPPSAPSDLTQQELVILWRMLQAFMENLERILIPPKDAFEEAMPLMSPRLPLKELQSLHAQAEAFHEELQHALTLYGKDPVLHQEILKLIHPMPSLLSTLDKMLELAKNGEDMPEDLTQELEEASHPLLANLASALQYFPQLFSGDLRQALEKYLQSPLMQEFLSHLPSASGAVLKQPEPQTAMPSKSMEEGMRAQTNAAIEEKSGNAKEGAPLAQDAPQRKQISSQEEGKAFLRGNLEERPSTSMQGWDHFPRESITSLISSGSLQSFTASELSAFPPALKNESIPLISSPHELQVLPEFVDKNPAALPLPFVVPYPAAFPFIQNFTKNAEVEKEKTSKKKSRAGKEAERKLQLFTFVPEGYTLYGDPFFEGAEDEQPLRHLSIKAFAIGVYPVTNAQYAEWLNDQWDANLIVLGEKGRVYDLENRLICQTQLGVATSDLETSGDDELLSFKAVKGKELYPVVHITYFGAESFCLSNGFRLPTEIEWEKAAGVSLPLSGSSLKKYRYGCSRNTIDPSLANYEERPSFAKKPENRSSPVGFFNGLTSYVKDAKSFQTENAASPYGCYDMSGNVREWTQKGDDDQKIVKGGSYESPSFDLRVSSRKWMAVNEADACTGFRVVLDIEQP
jgi:formylglycine-generating enzyme required for sulfatase activity